VLVCLWTTEEKKTGRARCVHVPHLLFFLVLLSLQFVLASASFHLALAFLFFARLLARWSVCALAALGRVRLSIVPPPRLPLCSVVDSVNQSFFLKDAYPSFSFFFLSVSPWSLLFSLSLSLSLGSG